MDLRWQEIYRTSLKTREELDNFFGVNFPDISYKTILPIPLANEIKKQGLDGPLAKQFLPNKQELEDIQNTGLMDPIGDHGKHIEGTMIIHRYKNRALLLPTHLCPITCRYCFRKNELNNEDSLFNNTLEKSLEYLRSHPEINEIILSGGDPLVLSDSKLRNIILSLAKIPSIKFFRIHTRMPVIIPQRIDDHFIETLDIACKHFVSIQFVIHINHASELSEELEKRINLIKQNTVNLLSQTVLLKGVNNSTNDLTELFYKLITNRIRPYYLHHPDQVRGAMHFRLPIEEGRELYRQLRDTLPGWAIPQYILDIPEGMGKVPLFNPENKDFSGKLIGIDGQYYPVKNH